MSRADLYYEQPSRWSRALIVLSALAVILLAVWVLTPIVLANLAATNAAVSVPREPAATPGDAKDLVITAQPAEPQAAPEPIVVTTREEPPPPAAAPAFAAANPSGFGLSSAPSSPAAVANAIPWPMPNFAAPSAAPLAAAPPSETDPEASMPPEDFGPVPLPRKRPNPALAAARSGIPMPRPRPDAVGGEAQAPDDSGMDALIERTSKVE